MCGFWAVEQLARGGGTEIAPRETVNHILEQWQRERPDLDPAPMRLFGLLAQAHLLTTPYLNAILAQWELSRGTFDVLAALRRSGPPYSLTPKQLSESLMLSGAGMTSRMDRLEAQHLIARLPEPSDRRSLKIQLTQRGVRLIDEVIPRVVEAQWAARSFHATEFISAQNEWSLLNRRLERDIDQRIANAGRAREAA